MQGSVPFWHGLGYRAWEAVSAEQRANLLTYESQACYMVKGLCYPLRRP